MYVTDAAFCKQTSPVEVNVCTEENTRGWVAFYSISLNLNAIIKQKYIFLNSYMMGLSHYMKNIFVSSACEGLTGKVGV